KYKVLAIVGCARPEQVHCSADIVIVIFERVEIRFPNVCVRGEVHDAPGFPGLEHSTKNPFVSQIASLEGPPLDRPVVASFKIVKRCWTVSSARQRLARMATDEACDRLRGSSDSPRRLRDTPIM